jgi:hypothetical protein
MIRGFLFSFLEKDQSVGIGEAGLAFAAATSCSMGTTGGIPGALGRGVCLLLLVLWCRWSCGFLGTRRDPSFGNLYSCLW